MSTGVRSLPRCEAPTARASASTSVAGTASDDAVTLMTTPPHSGYLPRQKLNSSRPSARPFIRPFVVLLAVTRALTRASESLSAHRGAHRANQRHPDEGRPLPRSPVPALCATSGATSTVPLYSTHGE